MELVHVLTIALVQMVMEERLAMNVRQLTIAIAICA